MGSSEVKETREELVAARAVVLRWLGDIKEVEHASVAGLRMGITDWIMEEVIILHELEAVCALRRT